MRMDQTILLTGRRGVGKTTVCQAVAELARRRGYRPGGVITPALYACPEFSRRACPEPFDFTQDRQSRRACPAGWGLGMGNWELTKVGFEAMDVGSGERWPLAHTDPSTGSGRGPSTTLRQGSGQGSGDRQELGGPRVGPYSFDPAALDRALRVLRRAIAAKCDLLMVDEIGPLELEQGRGFAPILDLIRWRSSRTCSAPAERETSFATPEENSEDSLSGERPMHTLIVVRPALLDPLLLRLRDAVGRPCRTGFTVFSVTEENRDELPLQIVETLWGDG
jgi:nucleoside-triphosphatase THEP1